MKKKIYAIFKIVIFLLILLICVLHIHNITKNKHSYDKLEDFFKQEENFDVLFFGSSHTANGIIPTELWNNYGIVSYNMGKHSERQAGSYYNMLLALKYTTPKLVVIDGYMADENDKYDKKVSNTHKAIDAYPISYTKYEAVKDIFEGENLLDREMEYLFNFSMYHSRWNELTKDDFKKEYKYSKGFEFAVNVAVPVKTRKFEEIPIYNKKESVNMGYLRKIIEHCKANNIDVLVTYIPHPPLNSDIASSKYLQKICDEYNVNYINFLSMDIVDYDIDCSDKKSHLNLSGAKKVTDYLGNYIISNYNIANQKNNGAYSFWNDDYNKYIDKKIDLLDKNSNELNNYLMLLYGEKDIRYEIKVSSKKEIKQGSVLQKLLLNLENKYEIEDEVFKDQKDKTIQITTYDNRNGALLKTVWF